MNSREFGELVAALRREQRTEHNLPYTQAKLAQEAKATAWVISNIERGEKANLESDLLVNLANAFHLSTREREHFFLAALKLDQQKTPETDCDTDPAFKSALAVIKDLALPALIVDHYDNVLAVNQIVWSLFGYSKKLQNLAEQTFAGYNVMRFVFSKQSLFANSFIHNRESYLLQCLHFFRALTLPVRATAYYQRMLEAFNTDPDMNLFRSCYAQSMYLEKDYLFENSLAVIRHPELGELNFYSPSTPIATAYGNIYMISYYPATVATAEAFVSLAKICSRDIVLLEKLNVNWFFERDIQ